MPELVVERSTAQETGFAERVEATVVGLVRSAGDDAVTGPQLWQALGRAGILVDLFEDGRPGPRLDRLGALLTILDARLPVGLVLSACVQAATAVPILREHATNAVLGSVCAAALRGDVILALAATDLEGAGSDLMALGTTATIAGDHLVMDGTKQWITNACSANYALVLARHRPQRHFTSFLWVLVPTDLPGVRIERASTTYFAGSGVGTLHFDGVRLALEHQVGALGRGLIIFARHVATERMAGALWASAICRRALAHTHRRLTERRLGLGVLWDDPAVQQRFAGCLVQLWRIETACATLRDGSAGDVLVSSMLLKVAIADSLDQVLGECVQLLGAESYGRHGLAGLHAETGMFGIAGGAGGAMLAGIAQHVEKLLGGTG